MSTLMNTRTMTPWLILLTSMYTTGCYSTWDINPKSLRNLDGFHKGENRDLVATDGEQVTFSSDTALDIRMRDGSYVQDFHVQSANLKDDQLVTMEDGQGRVRRLTIEIPNVEYVKAQGADGKKAAVATVIVLGVGALAGAVIVSGIGFPVH